MADSDYEDIFRFRKREISKDEILAFKESKKKAKKNKMSFVVNDEMSEQGFDSSPDLERIVPENWREDYKNFKNRTSTSTNVRYKPLVRDRKTIQ